MNNSEYKVVSSKNLAITISYLTSEDFFTYNDKFEQGKKCYSFKNTDKFKKALELSLGIRNNNIEL